MPTQRLKNLFQDSGPEAKLGYLWQRLQARDLSGQEALAVLGALHEELGRAEWRNPRLYASYGQFIEALRHDMPEVHQYVLSKWGESHRRPSATPPTTSGVVAADEAALSDTGETKPVFVNRPSRLIPAPELDLGQQEGPGEPWESDGDDDAGGPESRGGPGQGVDRPSDEAEATELELDEGQADGQEASEEEDSSETAELGEDAEQEQAAEAQDIETEPAEELAEESEAEEAEPEADQDEEASEGESAEAEPVDQNAGAEEGEWPAEEETEPLEPQEGFEGEEGEAPGVD